MFRKQFLLGLMLISASSAYALNLQEAYELALSNDPVYRSALKEYEAGMENESIGRAAVLPKVSANYNKSTNQTTQWGAQYTGGPNVSYNWSYPSDFSAVQLTQPIFSLEAMARWRQGTAQTDFSKSRFLFNAQFEYCRHTPITSMHWISGTIKKRKEIHLKSSLK